MGQSKNIFMEERLVSNCCGHGDVEVNFLGLLCTASGEGICPKCGEHCEYIKEFQREEEMRVEILTGKIINPADGNTDLS